MKQGTPPSGNKVTRAGWYTLGLVSATQMLSLLDRNILAILATDIKQDLDIGDAELGLLYGTVFALFYAMFSLPLGRLADGWIRTRLLAICITVWSVATRSRGSRGVGPLQCLVCAADSSRYRCRGPVKQAFSLLERPL